MIAIARDACEKLYASRSFFSLPLCLSLSPFLLSRSLALFQHFSSIRSANPARRYIAQRRPAKSLGFH